VFFKFQFFLGGGKLHLGRPSPLGCPCVAFRLILAFWYIVTLFSILFKIKWHVTPTYRKLHTHTHTHTHTWTHIHTHTYTRTRARLHLLWNKLNWKYSCNIEPRSDFCILICPLCFYCPQLHFCTLCLVNVLWFCVCSILKKYSALRLHTLTTVYRVVVSCCWTHA